MSVGGWSDCELVEALEEDTVREVCREDYFRCWWIVRVSAVWEKKCRQSSDNSFYPCVRKNGCLLSFQFSVCLSWFILFVYSIL